MHHDLLVATPFDGISCEELNELKSSCTLGPLRLSPIRVFHWLASRGLARQSEASTMRNRISWLHETT